MVENFDCEKRFFEEEKQRERVLKQMEIFNKEKSSLITSNKEQLEKLRIWEKKFARLEKDKEALLVVIKFIHSKFLEFKEIINKKIIPQENQIVVKNEDVAKDLQQNIKLNDFNEFEENMKAIDSSKFPVGKIVEKLLHVSTSTILKSVFDSDDECKREIKEMLITNNMFLNLKKFKFPQYQVDLIRFIFGVICNHWCVFTGQDVIFYPLDNSCSKMKEKRNIDFFKVMTAKSISAALAMAKRRLKLEKRLEEKGIKEEDGMRGLIEEANGGLHGRKMSLLEDGKRKKMEGTSLGSVEREKKKKKKHDHGV